MSDDPPMVIAARRSFASSVERDDRPLDRLTWIASLAASVLIFAGPVCGSVIGLSMILATTFPAGWSVLTALIWTGVAAAWLRWLWRVRP